MKKFIVGLILGLILATTIPAIAANLTANVSSYGIKVNGTTKLLNGVLLDVDGVQYLPVEDVKTLFGYTVSIDNSTKLISFHNNDDVDPDDIKKVAKHIPYLELAENSSEHFGKKVVYYGKVSQVIGGGAIRVNVTNDGTAYYRDSIYVYNIKNFEQLEIKEGNSVLVWGEYHGLLTYKTILNKEATIPHMDAAILEIYR